MQMQPAIEVKDLVVAYGQVEAVKGLSLSVPAGQAAGLVGANGAGKTTLLRTLAGLLLPQRGEVTVGGASAPADLRKTVAYAPDAGLLARCSVRQMGAALATAWPGFRSDRFDGCR